MEKIAIMQPYFFPYVGYFQLVNSVSTFVFLDDVQYITRGWINRNRILLNNNEHLFTIPCEKVSQNRRILDTRIVHNKDLANVVKTVDMAYKKAPYHREVISLFSGVLDSLPDSVSELAIRSVKSVCDFLGIERKFVTSSQYQNDYLSASERLMDICVRERTYHYVNPIGGTSLYSKEEFLKKGINLSFLRPREVRYRQFNNSFVPWLSMIDVLMFNGKDGSLELLEQYDLV